MPKPFPQEFRRDVVAVAARAKRQSARPLRIRGLRVVSASLVEPPTFEDDVRPGVTAAESAENRELKKRVRVLEQENKILPRAAAFFARDALPK